MLVSVMVMPFLSPGALAQDQASPSPAQGAPARATVQEILDRPELFIDSRLARVKDVAVEPEPLSTRNTRAQLLFSPQAAGRINRHTLLKLGSSCILLQTGQMLVSGRQDACTSSLRVSVRGTNYILEAFENGDAAVTSLEGRLDVVSYLDGQPGGPPAVVLESGQRLRLLLGAGLTTVVPLSSADYRAILKGPLFNGFQERLPSQGALDDYLRANVPGVALPSQAPRADGPRAPSPIRFGFGFGFGGSRSRPDQERQIRPDSTPSQYPR